MRRKPFWALFTAILLLTTLFPSTVLAAEITGPIDCTSGENSGGEGWKWDKDSNTLTIEANTTINVPSISTDGCGIKLPHGATLKLEGAVTIQAADGNMGTFGGVQFAGDGEITGGPLTVNNAGGAAVSVSAYLTLDDTTITGTGTGIAFTGANPTLNVSGNCSVSSISATTLAIAGSGVLCLSNEGNTTINYGSATNVPVFIKDSNGYMVLQNNAEITNNEITLSDGKTYIIPNDKTLTIGYGGSLTVPSNSTLQNNGTLNNDGGTMIVKGELVNNSTFNCKPNASAAPTTTIDGTVENNGTITNEGKGDDGTLSTITVDGTINNNNTGKIVNNAPAKIEGSGVINNNGTITDEGNGISVQIKTPTSTGGGGDSSPSYAIIRNDRGDMWLYVPRLNSNEKLRTVETTNGALAALAQGNTIIGIWDISLESGRSSTPGATLYMQIADLKEGQTYTLVHQNADGTLDYYYATANSQKTLAFSPINSLSPFMLVEGMLVAGEMNIPRTGDAADLLAPLVCVIAAAGLIVLRRKSRGKA